MMKSALRPLTVNIYETEPDETGFWAEVPELPGCVAQGETITEVQSNIIEAIEVWRETRREIDGDSHRPSLRASMSVLVDEEGLVPA